MEVDQRFHLKEFAKSNSDQKEQSTIDQCINNIIKKEGFITYDVNKKVVGQDGGNYLGTISEIDVKGKTDEGTKTIAIFVKTLPPNHVELGFICLKELYDKEKFVYFELSKVYNEIQDEANVPQELRYNIVKCYAEPYENAIFMENIARIGFQTWYRMDVLTLDYAEECIKQLARFHGLSFAMEVNRPNYFNNVLKGLKHRIKAGKQFDDFVELTYTTVLEHLDCNLKSRVEGKLRGLLDKYIAYLTEEEIVGCLCHGDYRPNNILYKTKNGKVTKVIPVDYQFVYYGCPLLDFFYVIYSGTDLTFRKNHLPYLKDLYYDTLTDYLKYFNVPVNSVFTRSQFDTIYKRKKDYGLILTAFIGPFLFASEDKVIDVTNSELQQWKMELDDTYKHRLNDAVKEFLEM